jgi:hypothetical protein
VGLWHAEVGWEQGGGRVLKFLGEADKSTEIRLTRMKPTHNGETSYAEEGIHTHPYSDHMKFERRYEATESMIKLL